MTGLATSPNKGAAAAILPSRGPVARRLGASQTRHAVSCPAHSPSPREVDAAADRQERPEQVGVHLHRHARKRRPPQWQQRQVPCRSSEQHPTLTQGCRARRCAATKLSARVRQSAWPAPPTS